MRAWLLLLLWAGCASGRYVYLPDGSRGRVVECSGHEQDWGDCMNRAHHVCDGAYRIVERDLERNRHARDHGSERKMLISCPL